jgi:hypothetical protein
LCGVDGLWDNLSEEKIARLVQSSSFLFFLPSSALFFFLFPSLFCRSDAQKTADELARALVDEAVKVSGLTVETPFSKAAKLQFVFICHLSLFVWPVSEFSFLSSLPFFSPFSRINHVGGKPDDTTVLIAKFVPATSHLSQKQDRIKKTLSIFETDV